MNDTINNSSNNSHKYWYHSYHCSCYYITAPNAGTIAAYLTAVAGAASITTTSTTITISGTAIVNSIPTYS